MHAPTYACMACMYTCMPRPICTSTTRPTGAASPWVRPLPVYLIWAPPRSTPHPIRWGHNHHYTLTLGWGVMTHPTPRVTYRTVHEASNMYIWIKKRVRQKERETEIQYRMTFLENPDLQNKRRIASGILSLQKCCSTVPAQSRQINDSLCLSAKYVCGYNIVCIAL